MENEIYQKGKERNESDIKRQKKKKQTEVKIREKQETYIWLTD